ncbi:Heat shock protein 70 family [Trinorchestia longiramus]|nr:Heat shock protein 70 family [Trinorchestia longiramus]
MLDRTTIGIDLGASKCCVASFHNGKLTVLSNARGEKTTPSFVAFNESRSLVGGCAKDQASTNPSNTVYGIKSILGRPFNDPVVRNYTQFSTCRMIKDKNGPLIEVNHRNSTLRISPELLAAMQILNMKQEAEVHAGPVEGAVVSVPAYFGNSQREAIVAACQIAGLELLELVSEPTATALTYRENRSHKDAETIMVFDMGAAKLDVAVIRVSEEEIKVLAVCGDDAFGGDNLDQYLMKFLDDQFFATNGKRLLDNPRSKMRLKMACEEVKKKLSLLTSSKVHQDSILGDLDLDIPITRSQFEDLFASKFSKKLTSILNSVLSSAKQTKDQIDEIVVVGGCARVPLVQSILKQFFNREKLNKTVNADECVANGAALLANDLKRGIKAREIGIIEMIQDPLITKRKNVEAAEAATNDLEGYCYDLQEELDSGVYSKYDIEVKKYVEELLEWVGELEEHSVAECDERRKKLSQLWDKMKLEYESAKTAHKNPNSSYHKTGGVRINVHTNASTESPHEKCNGDGKPKMGAVENTKTNHTEANQFANIIKSSNSVKTLQEGSKMGRKLQRKPEETPEDSQLETTNALVDPASVEVPSSSASQDRKLAEKTSRDKKLQELGSGTKKEMPFIRNGRINGKPKPVRISPAPSKKPLTSLGSVSRVKTSNHTASDVKNVLAGGECPENVAVQEENPPQQKPENFPRTIVRDFLWGIMAYFPTPTRVWKLLWGIMAYFPTPTRVWKLLWGIMAYFPTPTRVWKLFWGIIAYLPGISRGSNNRVQDANTNENSSSGRSATKQKNNQIPTTNQNNQGSATKQKNNQGSITNEKNSQVSTNKQKNSQVSTNKQKNNQVLTDKQKNNQVLNNKQKNNQVLNNKQKNNQVLNNKQKNSQVSTTKQKNDLFSTTSEKNSQVSKKKKNLNVRGASQPREFSDDSDVEETTGPDDFVGKWRCLLM